MENRKDSLTKKVMLIVLLFAVIFTCMFAIFLYKVSIEKENSEIVQNKIVALNEIEKLTETDGVSPALGQIKTLMNQITTEQSDKSSRMTVYLVSFYIMSMPFLATIYVYIYVVMLRSFQRLETYAGEIAKGNFEVPLAFERLNLFGAFTWAFDHMRKEVSKARACEKEAIENNKTVIATLSHDIKTPIASIRTYAEGLEANMDSTLERKERYLNVIMRKCDEVTALTNDLLLHSLSELDKLQIDHTELGMEHVIQQTVEAMYANKNDIQILGTLESAVVCMDDKRLAQVLENLINNARKYAPDTMIEIWTSKRIDHIYEIHVKDHGNGILAEDMPFVFHKFYRGKNVGEAPGAGLGLYIVQYIMEQMKGEVTLINQQDGLEAILTMPYIS